MHVSKLIVYKLIAHVLITRLTIWCGYLLRQPILFEILSVMDEEVEDMI